MELNHVLTICLFLGFIKVYSGFEIDAYDCNPVNNRLETEEYSLVETENCDDEINKQRYEEQPESLKVQILQTGKAKTIPVYRCSLRVTRKINFCYDHPIQRHYGSRKITVNEKIPMTYKQCKDAYEKGIFYLNDEENDKYVKIQNIEKGILKEGQILTNGNFTTHGTCDSVYFYRHHIKYHGYEQTEYKVSKAKRL